MGKTLNVNVSKFDSLFYPISAKFKLNKKDYSLIFESIEEMDRYFTNYFINKKIVYNFKGV